MSNYIYTFVLTICVSVALFHRSAFIGSTKYIFWLVCVTWLVEIVGLYYLKVLEKDGDWLYDIYVPIYYCIAACYFHSIITNTSLRSAILTSIPILLLCHLIGYILRNQINSWSTISFLLLSLLLSILSCLYLAQILLSAEEDHLSRNPNFWITTGFLFFYAGAFFQSGLHKYLENLDKNTADKLFMNINHMLNIILYGLFTYGFVCQIKYRKSQ
jgi:hypothetical protein